MATYYSFPHCSRTLTVVHRSYPAPNASYAVVTRRRDASFASLAASALTPLHLPHTQHHFTSNGSSSMHDSFGIDAFLLSSTLFHTVAAYFPPFLVGAYRWDNWLMADMLRASSAQQPVVDATDGWVAGHDSVQSEHRANEGAAWNDELVRQLMGAWWRVGNVDNADLRVVAVTKSGSGGGGTDGAHSSAGSDSGLSLEVSDKERRHLQMYRYMVAKQSKQQQVQQSIHSDVT